MSKSIFEENASGHRFVAQDMGRIMASGLGAKIAACLMAFVVVATVGFAKIELASANDMQTPTPSQDVQGQFEFYYYNSDNVPEQFSAEDFGMFSKTIAIDLPENAVLEDDGNKYAVLEVKKNGGGYAFADSFLIDGVAGSQFPTTQQSDYVNQKLAAYDLDVVEAKDDDITMKFDQLGEGIHQLEFTGRIESATPDGSPFLLDVHNDAHKGAVPERAYNVGDDFDNTYHTFPLSGHPEGDAYISVRSDIENVYFNADWTSDNTFDYGDDFFAVHVGADNSPTQTFKQTSDGRTLQGAQPVDTTALNSPSSVASGSSQFTYTDKAAYQHMTYQLVIPRAAFASENVSLGFELYGTAWYYSFSWAETPPSEAAVGEDVTFGVNYSVSYGDCNSMDNSISIKLVDYSSFDGEQFDYYTADENIKELALGCQGGGSFTATVIFDTPGVHRIAYLGGMENGQNRPNITTTINIVKNVTISYDLDGGIDGENALSSVSAHAEQDFAVPASTPTPPSYYGDFQHWCKVQPDWTRNAEGSKRYDCAPTDQIVAGNSFTPTDDVTLHAVYDYGIRSAALMGGEVIELSCKNGKPSCPELPSEYGLSIQNNPFFSLPSAHFSQLLDYLCPASHPSDNSYRREDCLNAHTTDEDGLIAERCEGDIQCIESVRKYLSIFTKFDEFTDGDTTGSNPLTALFNISLRCLANAITCNEGDVMQPTSTVRVMISNALNLKEYDAHGHKFTLWHEHYYNSTSSGECTSAICIDNSEVQSILDGMANISEHEDKSFDRNSNEISFETDRFSLFGITYSEDGTTPTSNDTVSSSTTSADELAQTGYSIAKLLLALVALLIASLALRRGKTSLI